MKPDGWHCEYVRGGVVRGRVIQSVRGGYGYQVLDAAGATVSYGGHYPQLLTALWEVEGAVQGQDARARVAGGEG
jgi:hypothetical protein